MKALAKGLLMLAVAFSLGGCVAGLAAGAVGAAVRGVRGEPESNMNRQPAAVKACSERASQLGAVNVIDVEQRTISRIIVYGTVEDSRQRRSFECAYGTEVSGFKLRPITRAK